jgi:dTDP-glucose 4,6-dehydratase
VNNYEQEGFGHRRSCFIAHHVIDTILEKTDWNVVTIDRLDFSGNLNRLHELLETKDEATRKRVRFVFHDLKAEIESSYIQQYW